MSGIKVLELFGGIGATTAALKNLGVDFEVADYVDNDRFATASYNAINGTAFEPQDICLWDKDLDVNLIVHGSPCQDFSVAGRNAGGDKGSETRSSLMWETVRIVEKLKPEYVIWENVKGVLSKKNRHNFFRYQNTMQELGYNNYFQILNAKDYGVPQNRERVFTVSIRNDVFPDTITFEFPDEIPLTMSLKDVLEDEVDERFYLSDETVASFIRRNAIHESRGNGFKFEHTAGDGVAHCISTKAGQRQTDNFIKVAGRLDIKGIDQIRRVYSPDGIAPTLSTMGGGNREPKILASRGRNPENPSDRTAGSPTEQRLEARNDGLTNTITSVQKDNYVLSGYRIRKLTPRECWRLMGRSDEDFDKVSMVCSNTQLYKQAGNSIVVSVLTAILGVLLCKGGSYGY